MKARLWTLALVAGLLASGTAWPQDSTNPKATEDSDPFPITVTASPKMVLIVESDGVLAGRKVTISGDTLPAGSRGVNITIGQEGMPSTTVNATPDQDGNYSFGEFAPVDDGEYTVTVTAPDGRGTASTTFTAIDIPDLEDKAGETTTKAADAAAEATAIADQKIAEMPASPVKDEAQKKLADAKQATQALKDAAPATAAALKGFFGAIQADAFAVSMSKPAFDKVTDAMSRADDATAKVNALAAKSSSALVGCDQLAFATEVFKAISALLNVKREIFEVVMGLAKDIDSDAAANKAKAAGAGPGLAFVSGQVVKNLPEITSASKLAGNAYGIMADLGAFVTDSLFNAYCEQFTGPIEGLMEAQFFQEAGDGPKMWWTYNFKISGRIILFYPKGASGDAIQMRGRIEGYAHDFKTWEDALTVMFPDLMAGTIQSKRNFPPIEIGAAASQIASQGSDPMSAYIEGSGGGLAAPNSFLVTVNGTLTKDSLTITLDKAVSDMNAKHRVTVLIASALAGGLPAITWYTLPFSDAFHLIRHAGKDQPMKLAIKTDDKTMTADEQFTNTVDKDTAKGDYVLSIKACNPGC